MEFITVRDFVEAILQTLPKPYGRDVVDQVFLAIENNPEYNQVYDHLVNIHGEYPTKNSIGLNVAGLTGLVDSGQVVQGKSKLIENYTELVPEPGKSGNE